MKHRRFRPRSQSSQRRGLSRIEVLVVTLLALTLFACCAPAALGLREEARKATCKDNLHKIGRALHDHHDAYNRFPPGRSVMWDFKEDKEIKNTGQGVGWMAYLLPYLNHQKLAKEIEPWTWPKGKKTGLFVFQQKSRPVGKQVGTDVIRDPKLAPFAATQIPHFYCNSGEQPKKTAWGFATASYAGSRGYTVMSDEEIRKRRDADNLAPIYDLGPGFFSDNGRFTKMNLITDGLTYTIAVSEASVPGPGGKTFQGNETFQPQWIGSPHGDWRALLRRVRHDQLPNTGPESFTSGHDGGVFALGGDGAVHFVSNDVHPAVWVSLGTIRRLRSADKELIKLAEKEWKTDKDNRGNTITLEVQQTWPKPQSDENKESKVEKKKPKVEKKTTAENKPAARNKKAAAGWPPWAWYFAGVGAGLVLVVGFLLVAGRKTPVS